MQNRFCGRILKKVLFLFRTLEVEIFQCFFERNIIVWTRGTQRKTQLLIKELVRSARELDAFLCTQKKLSDDNKLIHTLELSKESNGTWTIVHAEENLSKNKVCIYNYQLGTIIKMSFYFKVFSLEICEKKKLCFTIYLSPD